MLAGKLDYVVAEGSKKFGEDYGLWEIIHDAYPRDSQTLWLVVAIMAIGPVRGDDLRLHLELQPAQPRGIQGQLAAHVQCTNQIHGNLDWHSAAAGLLRLGDGWLCIRQGRYDARYAEQLVGQIRVY